MALALLGACARTAPCTRTPARGRFRRRTPSAALRTRPVAVQTSAQSRQRRIDLRRSSTSSSATLASAHAVHDCSAGEAFVDAADKDIPVELSRPGVGFQHLPRQSGCGHGSPFGVGVPAGLLVSTVLRPPGRGKGGSREILSTHRGGRSAAGPLRPGGPSSPLTARSRRPPSRTGSALRRSHRPPPSSLVQGRRAAARRHPAADRRAKAP